MSSSDRYAKPLTGRVIVGIGDRAVDTLTVQDVEGKKRPTWDEATNVDFINRVRDKAQDMARRLLEDAVREAAQIKEQARKEGMAQGFEQAQAEVERQMSEFAMTLGEVLNALQTQEAALFSAQRSDYARLVRMTVERAVGLEMTERRAEVLEALLAEALESLESLRRITLRCAPQDAEGLELLLSKAVATHPNLSQWQVKPDPSLASGGVVIETRTGMIDNSLDTRWQAVSAVLDKLAQAAQAPDADPAPGSEKPGHGS